MARAVTAEAAKRWILEGEPEEAAMRRISEAPAGAWQILILRMICAAIPENVPQTTCGAGLALVDLLLPRQRQL